MEDLNKEEKDLLRSLNIDSAKPNLAFKARLGSKVVSEYHKNGEWGTFAFGFLGLAALSLVIVFFGSTLLNQSGPTNIVTETRFTQAEKNNIYEQILKNNSLGIIRANVTPDLNNSNRELESEIIPEIQRRAADTSKLIEYSTRVEVVNNQCNLDIQSGTTTLNEYIDKERYFIKSVSRDLNRRITSYRLLRNVDKVSEEYTYDQENNITLFKSSNLKEVTEVSSYPLSSVVNIVADNPALRLLNGSNLLVKTRRDSKEFYVLETRSTFACKTDIASYPTSYLGGRSELVTLSYFDAETFKLELSETYLNYKEEGNLIYTQAFSRSEREIRINDLDLEFEYNLRVFGEEVPISYPTI